ncbi:PDR17 [Symbiodinium natans]|uniref:PDR17 protein n=1 Tax=Symbiodinium natans TaxID=878477 RepID=A0A812TMG7_9DINO|nr:PDR17 [Symbiodinium natans]
MNFRQMLMASFVPSRPRPKMAALPRADPRTNDLLLEAAQRPAKSRVEEVSSASTVSTTSQRLQELEEVWPSAAPRVCTGRAEWRRSRSLSRVGAELVSEGDVAPDLAGLEPAPGLHAMGLDKAEEEPKKDDDMLDSLFTGVGSPVSQLGASAAPTGHAEAAEPATQLPGQVDDGLVHINNKTTFYEAELGGAKVKLRSPSDYQQLVRLEVPTRLLFDRQLGSISVIQDRFGKTFHEPRALTSQIAMSDSAQIPEPPSAAKVTFEGTRERGAENMFQDSRWRAGEDKLHEEDALACHRCAFFRATRCLYEVICSPTGLRSKPRSTCFFADAAEVEQIRRGKALAIMRIRGPLVELPPMSAMSVAAGSKPPARRGVAKAYRSAALKLENDLPKLRCAALCWQLADVGDPYSQDMQVAAILFGSPPAEFQDWVKRRRRKDHEDKEAAGEAAEEASETFDSTTVPDAADRALAEFAHFSLPTTSEGFDEVRYEWANEARTRTDAPQLTLAVEPPRVSSMLSACCYVDRPLVKIRRPAEEVLLPARQSSSIHQVVAAAAQNLGCELSDWQRGWCTEEVVSIFLRGRHGDVAAAAQILAQALFWREQYRDVLSGSRLPKWQGDLRILAQGTAGQPLLYLCCRHQTCSFNVADTLDHVACVLETAVRKMRPGVQQVDAVIDCHGFCLWYNMDPRIVIGIAELLRQPYRDRLRTVMMVDAPLGLQPVWNVIYPLLPAATKRKVKFLSASNAVAAVQELQGSHSAGVLQHVMDLNRDPLGPGAVPKVLPCESEHWAEVEGPTPLKDHRAARVAPSTRGFCPCRWRRPC